MVSNTLQSVDWNAELIRGDDLVEKINNLKEKQGKGLLVGRTTGRFKCRIVNSRRRIRFIGISKRSKELRSARYPHLSSVAAHL